MGDLVILNNAGKNSKEQSVYVDTYLFRTDQKPRKGNMSKVYKGYRLSDIRIALQNQSFALPTSELKEMKTYATTKIIVVSDKGQSARTKHLLKEFRIIESNGLIEPIAIKVLFGDLAKIPMYRERFIRETRIRLDHPNIVKVLDYVLIAGNINGKHHIVMEYLNGRTLEDMLTEDKLLFSEYEALEIVKQVLEGLKAVHSQEEVTHRDIKASNIMRCQDGTVKIIDFGVAKIEADEAEKKLTGIATFIGTLVYASPEQVRMFNVGTQTDLWSTGVVLYHLLSNTLPFTGLNDEEIKRKILNEPVPPLPNVSNKVNQIIQKAMQKELKTRYQSAQNFIDDIEGVLRPVKPPSKISNGAYISLAITLLIAIIFYFIFRT